MADVQLNKPLYKSDGPAGKAESGPPPPRHPKPSAFSRAAALLIDVLLLHFVLYGAIKLAPGAVVALGEFGPWVGLLIAYLYFAVCGSSVTLGRTLGKLITRIQVCDIAGPDLPVGRAFARAACVVWPLALVIAFRKISEHFDQNHPLTAMPAIEYFSIAIASGWFLGNLAHAAFEPYARTLYDKWIRSVLINAECDPATVQQYLRDAREAHADPLPRRPLGAISVMMALMLAIATAITYNFHKEILNLSTTQRADMLKGREVFYVEGFGQPAVVRPDEPESKTDAVTTTVPEEIKFSLQYRRRSPISLEELKADPLAVRAVDRIAAFHSAQAGFLDNLRNYLTESNMARFKAGELMTSAPREVKFEVSFAEYADLLLARQAIPIYRSSKAVALPDDFTSWTVGQP